jgi:beta-xylosidase
MTVDFCVDWAFSDIFEEGGQQPQEFSNAFGLLTVDAIAKPS